MLNFNRDLFQPGKPLLILDIDETLLHATKAPLPLKPGRFENAAEPFAGVPIWDHQFEGLFIYKRPFVDTFLSQCSQWFQLAVWTSARSRYAREVVDKVFPYLTPLFVFSEQHCVVEYSESTNKRISTKPLSLLLPALQQVGYSLAQVRVLDDSPQKHVHHPDLLIPVAPFYGEADDRELLRLLPALQKNWQQSRQKNWQQLGSHQNVTPPDAHKCGLNPECQHLSQHLCKHLCKHTDTLQTERYP